MPSRICCSEGFGLSLRSPTAAIIIPGVQYPHCRPCSSQNAFWRACSWPSGASPSIVVIEEPSACTAKTVQDFTVRPSTRTVHAPHWLVSQPMWVPVSRRFSRRKWTRSTRGSTVAFRALPLTVIDTCAMKVISRKRLAYSKRDESGVDFRSEWTAAVRSGLDGRVARALIARSAIGHVLLDCLVDFFRGEQHDGLGTDRRARVDGDRRGGHGGVVGGLDDDVRVHGAEREIERVHGAADALDGLFRRFASYVAHVPVHDLFAL